MATQPKSDTPPPPPHLATNNDQFPWPWVLGRQQKDWCVSIRPTREPLHGVGSTIVKEVLNSRWAVSHYKQISLSFTDLLKAEYFHSRSVPAYFNLPNDYDRKKSRCVSVFNMSRKVPVNSYGWFGNFLFHSDYHRCLLYLCYLALNAVRQTPSLHPFTGVPAFSCFVLEWQHW